MVSLKAQVQINPPGSRTYFTVGSVDPINHTVSTGFAAKHATSSGSLIQVETVAIMGALAHVPAGGTRGLTHRFQISHWNTTILQLYSIFS